MAKKEEQKKSPKVAVTTVELFLLTKLMVKFLVICHQLGLI